MPVVRDFASCRLALQDPGDPDAGLPGGRICSWTGLDCGPGPCDGPQVRDCPRFETPGRAPCPHCAYRGRETELRRDPEYGTLACPRCPEGWFGSDRELFQGYATVLAWMAGEREKLSRAVRAAQVPAAPGNRS